MEYILIKDNRGFINKWTIEEETEKAYKLFCRGYIRELSKRHTYAKENELYSSDIRNPFPTLENRKYSKSAFTEIYLTF